MESLCANGGWGGPHKLFLSSSFFLLSFFLLSSFRTGDGLGFIRFCSWDVCEGGPALGSGGLGGGLGGLGGGLGGVGGGRGGLGGWLGLWAPA